jgi:hypothetical protein
MPRGSTCDVDSELTSLVAVRAGRESGRVALLQLSRAPRLPAEWEVAPGTNEAARQPLEAGGKNIFMLAGGSGVLPLKVWCARRQGQNLL